MLDNNLLRKVDMQDLTVFVQVYERGSVTAVSEALCVSQSTISYCLRKLRAVMNDDLFIPSRGSMTPTTKADTIYPNVIQIIDKINICHSGEITQQQVPDARIFQIQAPEYFELLILPKLLASITNPPSVSINIRKFEDEIPTSKMESGDIDLAICFGPNYHRKHLGHQAKVLLHDDFVCVTDKKHSVEGDSFTFDEFLERKHVYPTPWITNTNMIDGWLFKKGRSRNIAATANSYYAALGLIKDTDYILTLPRRIFDKLASCDYIASAPPVGFPRFTLDMVWTTHAHRDPDIFWLRQKITSVLPNNATGPIW
jgi:DNA-binding transcriptional LysR family regulator